MVEFKNKFFEAAHAARKGKAIAGMSAPPPKRAHRAEEIIMLSPPPPPPTTKELAPILPESSTRDTPPTAPTQTDAPQPEVDVGATWPKGIQHLALALTRSISLLEEPRLSTLIAKRALRPGDCHPLHEVETDDLYDNIMHSAMKSALCAYIAKERNKTLR